jgi:hypothetical protein
VVTSTVDRWLQSPPSARQAIFSEFAAIKRRGLNARDLGGAGLGDFAADGVGEGLAAAALDPLGLALADEADEPAERGSTDDGTAEVVVWRRSRSVSNTMLSTTSPPRASHRPLALSQLSMAAA